MRHSRPIRRVFVPAPHPERHQIRQAARSGADAFNLISEVSRTLALAVRLFGNMMSGAMIIAILLVITPFIFPIVMTLLGLLTGMVQAYIFSILAAVYIAAATRTHQPKPETESGLAPDV